MAKLQTETWAAGRGSVYMQVRHKTWIQLGQFDKTPLFESLWPAVMRAGLSASGSVVGAIYRLELTEWARD